VCVCVCVGCLDTHTHTHTHMESREQKPEDGAMTTELSTYYYLRGHDH
jgi:hypothetical protein